MPQVGLLCLPFSYRAPVLVAWTTGGTAVVLHLDRTSDDSDTSFPSRVSMFFTSTILEELVLVRLKELELPPGPRLAWRPRLAWKPRT